MAPEEMSNDLESFIKLVSDNHEAKDNP